MHTAVRHLLDSLPRHLHRDALEPRGDPELLMRMKRWGPAWAAWLSDLGLPCPPALVDLANAMDTWLVHVSDAHGWDLLTPDEAREAQEGLTALAPRFPELTARSHMAPVFGQDGDLLLLAADGSVHAFTHDDWELDGQVAATLEELLERLARRDLRLR